MKNKQKEVDLSALYGRDMNLPPEQREARFIDDVREGFHHTDPEVICKMMKNHEGHFTDRERKRLIGKVMDGLGDLYHRFDEDKEQHLHYTCRSGEAIVREFRGNNGLRYLGRDSMITAMTAKEKDLNDFEKAKLENLRYEAKIESQSNFGKE